MVTGTVLNGSVKVNDMVEIPHLRQEKKVKPQATCNRCLLPLMSRASGHGTFYLQVKSIQMFHRPVKRARQGDRLGMCLANLDAKLLERAVASTPGTVPMVESCIAVIRKIRYFRGIIRSGSKFHVTVGHSTVLATVTFFGGKELTARFAGAGNSGTEAPQTEGAAAEGQDQQSLTSLTGTVSDLPSLPYDFDQVGELSRTRIWTPLTTRASRRRWQDFSHQDEIMGRGPRAGSGASSGTGGAGPAAAAEDEEAKGEQGSGRSRGAGGRGLQWALLQFETPIYAPLDSLLIASRLDTEDTKACRMAFYGRLLEKLKAPDDLPRLRIFKMKQKVGVILRPTISPGGNPLRL